MNRKRTNANNRRRGKEYETTCRCCVRGQAQPRQVAPTHGRRNKTRPCTKLKARFHLCLNFFYQLCASANWQLTNLIKKWVEL